MQTKTYDPTLLEIAHRIRDMRDIAGFTAEEIENMKSEIAEKEASMLELYTVENKINL